MFVSYDQFLCFMVPITSDAQPLLNKEIFISNPLGWQGEIEKNWLLGNL